MAHLEGKSQFNLVFSITDENCTQDRLTLGYCRSRAVQLASILAVAAKKTKRPVRAMLNRDEGTFVPFTNMIQR